MLWWWALSACSREEGRQGWDVMRTGWGFPNSSKEDSFVQAESPGAEAHLCRPPAEDAPWRGVLWWAKMEDIHFDLPSGGASPFTDEFRESALPKCSHHLDQHLSSWAELWLRDKVAVFVINPLQSWRNVLPTHWKCYWQTGAHFWEVWGIPHLSSRGLGKKEPLCLQEVGRGISLQWLKDIKAEPGIPCDFFRLYG